MGCWSTPEPEPAKSDKIDAGNVADGCISWFHNCNCSYACTTESAYNARLENGEANCDDACDPSSEADVPTESCEEVDGVCQWVSE